jgi:predicted RNA binding protein YcfA (HicA-like mRNA interferase family)
VTRVEKLLEQMRQRPAGWRFEEVERVLIANGFVLKNQRGSDRVYKHDTSGVRVFFSWHGSGEVKRGYVRAVVRAIDDARRKR